MALSDLELRMHYETQVDDVIDDLYVPCLKESVLYEGISGFFSAVSLKMLAAGLCPMISNNYGRIHLILSTALKEDEAEAISKGYELRETIEKRLLTTWEDPRDEFEKGYLSLLSYLVSHGILDIKIGVLNSGGPEQMLHEKINIFTDCVGNVVLAHSSGNLTANGLLLNRESTEVFCSWNGSDTSTRCQEHKILFNRKWTNHDSRMQIIEFPEAVKEKILVYKDSFSKEELENLDREYARQKFKQRLLNTRLGNANIKYYDYQRKAIQAWKENDYRGYFDMATGTGKTITSLGAVVSLVEDPEKSSKSFFLLIVVPQINLVYQWNENCEKYKIKPLICCGNSRTWLTSFQEYAAAVKGGYSKFEAAIITSSSLIKPEVLSILETVKKRTIFLADECHNLGASQTSQVLSIDFRYRLGLSATITRHHDALGTDKILNFFGTCLIRYTLPEAIENGVLCHYRYYPILVALDDDERYEYLKLTKKIMAEASYLSADEDNQLRRDLIKRSIVVAGARNKLGALDEAITNYEKSKFNLVYCGSVTYKDRDPGESQKQISDVLQLLNGVHKMKAFRFTAQEDPEEREKLISLFKDGTIDTLVAIRCLDEGIDIPCIRTAFILASTTNPKEYIQRRGRLLRQDYRSGKRIAEIYDFVTITRPLSQLKFLDDDAMRLEQGLAKRELQRVEEFANEADNASDSEALRSQIMEAYRLDQVSLWEDSGDNGY